MSDISGGQRRYERVEYSVPLSMGRGLPGSSGHAHAGPEVIHGLINRMEVAAAEHGVSTNYDDWFHVDVFEDDRLVFWFDLPDKTAWVNG